jgi:N-acetylneuraminate synthase/sialic acid synthase
MRQLTIDNHLITDNSDCFVIAEVGHNHGGSLETCKQLFKAAKECGADAVKLQKRDNKSLFTKTFYNSPYDNPNSYGKTYGEHREALEFGLAEYADLQLYADELGIIFFATAFDIKSADFLRELGMPAYKIASADLTNMPLIEHIARFEKPMVVSTGGSSGRQVDRVYSILMRRGVRFAFLHCIATYPNNPEDMNLACIEQMRDRYDVPIIGLSDHYNGICMAEAAYVMGARIIEKHFTLNHSWKGTDHALSLEPQGLTSLVQNLKRLRLATGDGEKRVLETERKGIEKMGKAIYPSRHIKSGELVNKENIRYRSPGGGFTPVEVDEVLGKIALIDLSTAVSIKKEDVEGGENE